MSAHGPLATPMAADASAGADGAFLEALASAAVAMPDALAVVGPRPHAAVAVALRACAEIAERRGLRGLGYVTSLVAPWLERRQRAAAADGDGERLADWTGHAVAFCSGLADPLQAAALIREPAGWPGFAAMPAQFVNLVAERLIGDAATLRQWHVAWQPTMVGFGTEGTRRAPAGEDDAGDAAAAPGSDEVRDNEAGISADEAVASEGPVTVARDELRMLAEAAAQMAEETSPSVLGLPLPVSPESAAAWTELLDGYAEKVRRFGNAAGFIGLHRLAAAFERIAVGLASLAEDPGQAPDELQSSLLLFPELWGRCFDAPDVSSIADAVALLGDAGWPARCDEAERAEIARSLSALTVVQSRQVERRSEEIGDDDLSLQIPVNAEPQVVDNLLRELPQLSEQFSAAIAAIRAGSSADLERAQRIAHTLKGSANTVGIRGVANLTHQLEDILQLLARDHQLPPPALADQLADAADCLAEMSDAVAGLGAPPGAARDVYRATVAWVNRLLHDDESAGESQDRPHPTVEATPARARPADEPAADVLGTTAGHDPESGAATALSSVAGGSTAEPPSAPARIDADGVARTDRAASIVLPELPTLPVPAPMTMPARVSSADEEQLRVPASLVDRLLDLAGEAAIALAQVQEQLARLDDSRGAFRDGAERLQQLSAELTDLVELRSSALTDRRVRNDFDPLELEQFDELHTVSQRIAETGADTKLVERQLDQQLLSLRDLSAQLERVQAELRDNTMAARLVPVATIAARLQRATRQAARMSGRHVELVIRGEDTAVDGQLLQQLLDPLGHLLRNAVDHGIEDEVIRIAAGKPATGRIEISFARAGRHLVITCQDDGRGLDLAAIEARARAGGLLAADQAPGERELARLILEPGFSTRAQTTQLSGRGIGLDVVHEVIEDLRGAIDIDFVPGGGTRFTLSVPLRLAALPVIVARTPTHVLALSVRSIEQILPADALSNDDEAGLLFVFQDQRLPAFRLDQVLGLPEHSLHGEQAAEVVMLVRMADGDLVALVTPELGQTRSVIVRPLPAYLGRLPGIEGAAVLGDGAVAPILDLPEAIATRDRSGHAPAYAARRPNARPVCLVVDDSVSVRRSMASFVGDLGFDVDSAGDGLEALARLQKRRPDLLIVDLEMPRMNGVELTGALRMSPETRDVPVIMITSRSTDKHQRMARDAGVDVFLTKPVTEDDLAAHIRRCLEPADAARPAD